jgi:hypothetical protein
MSRAVVLSALLPVMTVGGSQTGGLGPMKPARESVSVTVEHGRLTGLFSAVLQYRSDAEQGAVVPREGREGEYIGSGDGTATGDRVSGTLHWSLWAGACLYPLVRKGQTVPDGLHLCTMNPVGFIETGDGARIRLDGRGYGLRSMGRYRTSLTLVFGTEDPRYAWLTTVLGLVEGEFDEKAGRATWEAYMPAPANMTTQPAQAPASEEK